MIHVSGSLAFDRIMTFPGHFEDHILPEKLHFLNVCFPIDHIEEKRGGTAGNIAYSLALLGEPSSVYATVGRDFSLYGSELAQLGVNLDGVKVNDAAYTACAYITTDQAGNQITGFCPSAMTVPSFPEKTPQVQKGDWAIIGPGNPDDMVSLAGFYRENAIPFIFDPGQQITTFDGARLSSCIDGAAVLIGNDYEIDLVEKLSACTREQLLDKAGAVIVTFGGKGSLVMQKGEKDAAIPAVQADAVLDPTGAGDSYRSGLLKGLHAGMGVVFSAKLGAVSSSFCVEKCGTQVHSFTMEQFRKRYEAAFGPMPLLK